MADSMPKLADSMPKLADSMPKLADSMPKPADSMPKPADSMPKPVDFMPKSACWYGPLDLLNSLGLGSRVYSSTHTDTCTTYPYDDAEPMYISMLYSVSYRNP